MLQGKVERVREICWLFDVDYVAKRQTTTAAAGKHLIMKILRHSNNFHMQFHLTLQILAETNSGAFSSDDSEVRCENQLPAAVTTICNTMESRVNLLSEMVRVFPLVVALPTSRIILREKGKKFPTKFRSLFTHSIDILIVSTFLTVFLSLVALRPEEEIILRQQKGQSEEKIDFQSFFFTYQLQHQRSKKRGKREKSEIFPDWREPSLQSCVDHEWKFYKFEKIEHTIKQSGWREEKKEIRP